MELNGKYVLQGNCFVYCREREERERETGERKGRENVLCHHVKNNESYGEGLQ
jgi:hypothetical protein